MRPRPASRSGMRARPLLVGAVAVLVAEALVAVLVVVSGVVDVAATTKRPLPDRILAYASTRSIAHHAPDQQNPRADDPAALREGLQHYKAMCVDCHGGPGAIPEEFAAGLHPPPPDLASRAVRSFTDGMLYDVVARGIGSTGMPAFGKTHSPEQIWSIVAFVRHLPELTPDERRALGAEAPPEGGHEDHEHGAASEAAAPGARVHTVAISNFKFEPASLQVRAGDVVEWRNDDFVAHTATAEGGAFDTGGIAAGASGRVVVKQRGTFPYFCRYHLEMKGTLTVE